MITPEVAERERKVATDNYLFKSALRLSRLCRKHFSIVGEPGKLRVDGVVRPADVTNFLNEYRAAVRPEGLGSDKALPSADDTMLRVFLWAAPIADAVVNDVVRLSLYSDQIVVVDPFSAHFLASESSLQPPPLGPHIHPENWTEPFANLGLMVCSLEPWIEKRLVIVIPEPMNFVKDAPPFWNVGMDAMRLGFFADPPMAELLQDMLESTALTAVDENELAQLVDLELPELPVDARLAVLAGLGAYRRAHPTRYTPVRLKAGSSIIKAGAGQNVFEAAWIADRVGGYLVPRGAADRSTFRSAARGDQAKDNADALASAFANAPLPMLNNVSLSDALQFRQSGRLSGFRTLLRDVWAASSDPAAGPKTIERERQFVDRLTSEYAVAKEEWQGIYKDLGVKGAGALFATPLAQVIEGGLIPAAVGAGAWLLRDWTQSTRNFHRRPSGLLVQLENQSSPNPIRRAVAALEHRA